jgi:hypothetical protein
MRKAALLVFIAAFAAFAPLAAAAKGGGIKRLDSIPDAYWGTWAPAVGSCKDGGAEAIVLAAKAYTGPLGKCDVASVSETPSQKGPTYSARLQCADARQAPTKASAYLIIRSVDANQISVGPGFESLRAYQRCSESTPTSK